jgi:hypothetical protein
MRMLLPPTPPVARTRVPATAVRLRMLPYMLRMLLLPPAPHAHNF